MVSTNQLVRKILLSFVFMSTVHISLEASPWELMNILAQDDNQEQVVDVYENPWVTSIVMVVLGLLAGV